MEIRKKKDEIFIKYKLKKNETYRIQEGSKFKSVTFLKKPQLVRGISNECEDNKAVLFIDYDNVDKRIVLEDYKYIQRLFSLPQGYLFQTKKGNYHVICLKKFLHSEIYEILLNTRCDQNYKDMALRNPFRSYVLRLSDKKGSKKPKFLGIIGRDENNEFEVSNAHYTLLRKVYNVKPINFEKKDKGGSIKFHTYETSG